MKQQQQQKPQINTNEQQEIINLESDKYLRLITEPNISNSHIPYQKLKQIKREQSTSQHIFGNSTSRSKQQLTDQSSFYNSQKGTSRGFGFGFGDFTETHFYSQTTTNKEKKDIIFKQLQEQYIQEQKKHQKPSRSQIQQQYSLSILNKKRKKEQEDMRRTFQEKERSLYQSKKSNQTSTMTQNHNKSSQGNTLNSPNNMSLLHFYKSDDFASTYRSKLSSQIEDNILEKDLQSQLQQQQQPNQQINFKNHINKNKQNQASNVISPQQTQANSPQTTKNQQNSLFFTSFRDAQYTSSEWNNFSKKNIENKNDILLTKRTLNYNLRQKDKIHKDQEQIQSQTYSNFKNIYSKEQDRYKKLPKIRTQLGAPNLKGIIDPKTNAEKKIFQDYQEQNKPYQRQRTQGDEQEQENIDTLDDILIDPELCFHFHKFNITDEMQRPEIGEQSQLFLWKDKLILHGGVGRNVSNQFNELDLHSFKWNLNLKQYGDVPEYGRFGHSCTSYKNGILTFGGQKEVNMRMKQINCGNDLKFFDPSTHNWQTYRLYGDVIENRRNHQACFVGKFLFIIGGMNNFSHFLKDVNTINLETNKSQMIDVQGFEKGIAFHTALPVFRGDIIMDKPYTHLEHKKFFGERQYRKIKEEGILIFGGKKEDGKESNKINLIRLGHDPIKMVQPQVLGQPPLPRYQHTMTHHPEQNILIIVGGRNDHLYKIAHKPHVSPYISSKNPSILKDISVFNLEFFQWTKVTVTGNELAPIYSHSAAIVESKLIIFGGFNDVTYNNADLKVFELNQNKAQKFKREKIQQVSQQDIQKLQMHDDQQHLFNFSNLEKSYKVQGIQGQKSAVLNGNNNNNQTKKDNLNYKDEHQQSNKNLNNIMAGEVKKLSIRTYQPLPQKVMQNMLQNQRSSKVLGMFRKSIDQQHLKITQNLNNQDDSQDQTLELTSNNIENNN